MQRLRVSLRLKFFIVFVVTFMGLTVITGYLSYSKAKKALEDQLGHRLVSIASTGSLMIDGDAHATLKTPQDEGTEVYKEIKAKLQHIRDINKATYVYTLAPKNEEKVIFVVDAATGEDMSNLGDEYDLEPEIQKALQGQTVYTEEMYTDQWGTFKTGYAPIKNSQGQTVATLAVDISAQQVLDEEKALLNRYYYAGGIALLVGIVLSILFSGYLTRPIRKMVKSMQDIADMQGDLTQEIKVSSHDEIGDLAGQFNRMLANLCGLIGRVRESIGQVAQTSNELYETSHRARLGTEEIVEAIANTVKAVEDGSADQRVSVTQAVEVMKQFYDSLQQVASGAVEQEKHVVKTAGYVNEIAEEIRQVAQNSTTVADSSNKTAVSSAHGREVILRTLDDMGNIKVVVDRAAKTIKALGDRSKQIGEIILVIDEIASQTNLLALNAAIEAARAGIHGKGFAVVADEIRKLAERSSKSTKAIEELVASIAQGIEQAVAEMNAGTQEVERVFERAGQASVALQDIHQLADQANLQIQQIKDATDRMLDKSEDMVGAINTVAAIVEENAAASGEMADGSINVKAMVENIGYVSEKSALAVSNVGTSGQEMKNVVENIARSAETMALMARDLENLTAQFKLN
ncbi:MAG: methyl-accepting chemotaxis protein [Thermincola sp.]|jgi:methyl-accepting chemotaxis protein|nr:methyl-accepting chemotaxis protein [Thermincola sp.]MDT3704009.1 methyl-accepting chemotaxis protein [Thermincola sp.]